MKSIENLFEKTKKHFTEGGRFEKYYPVYEAFETFFLFPLNPTRRSPHVRDHLDVKRFMSFVIVALLPPLFYGIYNAGYQSHLASGLSTDFAPVFFKGLTIVLPLIVVSYGVGFFWEFLFAIKRGHAVSEGLLVTGLLFPLTLPPTIPLWQAAVGISFGVVVGKEIFGGTGRNLLNPALTGRAFLFFAYPARMSGDSVWAVVSAGKEKIVDAFTGATPLALSTITQPNENIASALKHNGYSFWKLLIGAHPGSIGETSAILCFAGAAFLILIGIASYRIIIGGVIGALATGLLVNMLGNSSPWYSLNPLYHLVMGGFAFGIAYMATDPVSAPGIDSAKWIYGFLIGALTIMIRVFNPAYPEGVMLSILFMNIFAPFLDHFAIKARLRKRIPNV